MYETDGFYDRRVHAFVVARADAWVEGGRGRGCGQLPLSRVGEGLGVRAGGARETGLPEADFPKAGPYKFKQVDDDEFRPD
jgi:hypothetical protein